MKRVFQSLVSVLLATIILVAGTWAYQMFRDIPCDLTIIEGITDIEIYTNEACTVSISGAVHFGELRRGSTVTFYMWAKNIGVEPVLLVATLSGDMSWGTVTLAPSSSMALARGEIQRYVLQMIIQPDTWLGAQEFSIEFYEE
ncbi:MAG: hypothetical protein KAS32_05130 [Candidatus Peribacteraceae bacterium]|nr:hypothetical protein [Candidatus Peribacteraceae bacterium]